MRKEHFQRGFAIRKLYSVIWVFTSCNRPTQVLCTFFFFLSLHFLVNAQSQSVPLESSLDSNSSQFLSCKNLSYSAVKSNCPFHTFFLFVWLWFFSIPKWCYQDRYAQRCCWYLRIWFVAGPRSCQYLALGSFRNRAT